MPKLNDRFLQEQFLMRQLDFMIVLILSPLPYVRAEILVENPTFTSHPRVQDGSQSRAAVVADIRLGKAY